MSALDKRSAAQLFNNPLLADVTIKQISNGKTREYHAHKAVLRMESEYYLKAFTGNFKEASDNVLELHDDDPDHFEILLKYIYTYTYDKAGIEKLLGKDTSKRIAIPIGVYAVADKYDVPSIYNPIINDVQTLLVGVAGAGWQKNDVGLIRLETALHTYYKSTVRPEGPLAKMLVGTVMAGRRGFTRSAEYEQLVRVQPAFAADMALALAQDAIHVTCNSCSGNFMTHCPAPPSA